MRVRLKGINRVRKRLASGQYRTYYYAWKGGPRLEGKPGSPQFHSSYCTATAARTLVPPDQLVSVLEQYRRSSEFLVRIPVGQVLQEDLINLRQGRAAKNENYLSEPILLNSNGQPWTESGFRASWRKACIAAGITDLTFHDLRGTAVTRLARAGCTVPEIATITGHSLRDVGAILDGHYLHRDEALAKNAIRKLEGLAN